MRSRSRTLLAACAAALLLAVLAVAPASAFDVAAEGDSPDVAISTTGLAHVAWAAPAADNSGNHLFTCPIARGEEACEHVVDLGLIDRYALGTHIFVFAPDDHRVIVAAAVPDTQREGVWLSTDKGTTFQRQTSPFPAADSVVYTGSTLVGSWSRGTDAPASDTVFVSAASVGGSTAASAAIKAPGGGPFLGNDWLALRGKAPVVTFSNPDPFAGRQYVAHVVSDAADPNQSSSWTAPVAAPLPLIAGGAWGPAGVFASTWDNAGAHARPAMRRFDGSTYGAATIFGCGDYGYGAATSQDSTGRLTAVYAGSATGTSPPLALRFVTAADGDPAHFSTPATLDGDPGTFGGNPGITTATGIRVATGSGGGLAVWPASNEGTHSVRGAWLPQPLPTTRNCAANQPPPTSALRLSRTRVNFGSIAPDHGVGHDERVTATNTGHVPVHVASVAVAGGDRSAFSVPSQTCTRAPLAPGASCAVDLKFSPGARQTGAQRDTLVLADDAAGAPHRVALAGLSETGHVSGIVHQGSWTGPAVAGATVYACWTYGSHRCYHAVTGADGVYDIAHAPRARYEVRVDSGYRFLPGYAVGDVNPGLRKDFVLHAPGAKPDDVQLSSSTGPAHTGPNGEPYMSAASPFSIRVPTNIPAHSDPNSRRLYVSVLQLTSDDGTDDPHPRLNLADALIFTARYGAHGELTGVSKISEGIGQRVSSPPSASVAALRSPRGARDGGSLACLAGVVSIRPTASGVRIEMPFVDGPLAWDIEPIQIPEPASNGTLLNDFVLAGLVKAANGFLGAAPGSAQYNALVQAANAYAHAINGNQRRTWLHAFNDYLLPALGDRFHTGDLRRFTPGGFRGDIAYAAWQGSTKLAGSVTDALSPATGDQTGCVTRTGGNAHLYVDPSGRVVARDGAPLARAKVVLRRAATKKGRLKPVRNGSTVMSPKNRRNPDRTDAQGHFGWDVIPGWYRVEASLRGCRRTKRTKRLQIPPPVTDLLIRLPCRGPRRTVTSTRLRVRRTAAGAVLTARVSRRHRHGRLAGTVAFRRRGRLVASLPLTSRGTAVLPLPRNAGKGGRFRAVYGGSATYRPSRSRIVR